MCLDTVCGSRRVASVDGLEAADGASELMIDLRSMVAQGGNYVCLPELIGG